MKNLFTFLLLITSSLLFGQELYMVYFKPKANIATYISNPLLMVSQRAIDRRNKRNIIFDDKDVPLNESQINALKALNVTFVGASKWLNAAMIEINDQAIISQINQLSFVQSAESLVRNSAGRLSASRSFNDNQENFNYEYSQSFIQQLNLNVFHNAGYTGQNVLIGVIDSGFPGVNTLDAFAALRNENRIIDTKNFVNSQSVYTMDNHGTNVLATMAAKIDGEYVGTAPDATYALYVSEDARPESPKELMYWIQAAERADSVGVDVINTSLGYSTFDDSRYDYTYADMDGNTTLITKGANIAASRGIFLVNAMGNDGTNSWRYLTAPADSPNVFSVGANDIQQNAGRFSSYGPNSVGILKPNVSALGVGTPTYNTYGNIYSTNGTSFSSPIIAGAVATLISAFPNKSISELKTDLEQSAHLYPNHHDQIGFGIPNFASLFSQLATDEVITEQLEIFPNPVSDKIIIRSANLIHEIELLDWNGIVLKKILNSNEMNIAQFRQGTYFIRVKLSNGKIVNHKIIKN